METLNQIPWKAQEELFEKLEELSRITAMNDDERAQYNEYLRQYRDNIVVREAARQEGRAEGRAEGMEQETISRCTGLSEDVIRMLK